MSLQDQIEQADRLFAGSGEMRSLMRGLDWSSTPIGPVSGWPQSLKATIRILLASQYPMVLTWGPEFTQFYNDAYANLIGNGHPAALGGDIRITLAEGWATLGPMIETVMATGIANWTPALPLLMERSGYREEAYFSVSHAPAENDDGQIVGMLAVCSEVTSQVIGERRLTLLRDLASRTGDVSDVSVASKTVAAVLAEHPLDAPFSAVLLNGDNGLELVADINCPHHVLAALPLASVLETNRKEAFSLAETNVPLGGLWADPVRDVFVLPLEGRRKTPIGILVIGVNPARELDDAHLGFLDLLAQQASIAFRNARAFEEERRRAEELAAIDKAKTDFFSNVSHEFRTPLTLMLGPLEEALAARPSSLPQHRGALEVVHRNALRLLRLVNTLLEFSRVEAQRAEAKLEPTDLPRLTADLVSSFRSAAERLGLALQLDLPPLPLPVRVDRDMWENIVLNLVSNALKHTRAGSITVAMTGEPTGICLAVNDTGIGIAAEELPRIFERFHRVETLDARSFEGSGIGLALVKELVGLHGGTIDVESARGKGSRFIVTLPATLYASSGSVQTAAVDGRMRRAHAEEAAQWNDRRPVEARAEGILPRVLLADDNADMRDYIFRLLDGVCDVTAVGDGEAAATAAAQGAPFNLVLTDVMMPRLDGFGLIRRLRSDPRTAGVPVIMLSARAGQDARVEGIEAGADDYLVKPFSARELVARVRANLELSRMRRELTEAEARVARLEAIGQLTGGVAHDFNNLLTAVSGSLELLSRRASDRPDLMRFISVAQAGAMRGAKLTSQLLAFARRQPLSPQHVDVNDQLQEFLPLLRATVGAAIELVFTPSSIMQICKVDPSQLEVAVMNLVINARDALQPGGRITIEISELSQADHAFTCIAVSDNGDGMSAEVRERAIEPFFTTKDVGAGTGLGLSQVYGFARQSAGRLEIDSEVGVGSSVRILLPRSRADAVPAKMMEEQGMETGRLKILVVEDEEQVRMIAAEVLRDAGYQVVEASDAHDAFAAITADMEIDFLLTDVSMPGGLSGIDLARKSRAQRPGLPVLLTSGYAEALQRGDHGFPLLPKPYSTVELVRRLRVILEGEPLQKNR